MKKEKETLQDTEFRIIQLESGCFRVAEVEKDEKSGKYKCLAIFPPSWHILRELVYCEGIEDILDQSTDFINF